MIHLNSLVDLLNVEIESGITSLRSFIVGVTRRVEQNKQLLNYDEKQNIIAFDNAVDINVYHRKLDSSISVIQEKGKKKTYLITARMELVCYSKLDNTQDYLIDRISNMRDFEITGTDDDSVKIFKDEIGSDLFDPLHYVFKILYTLKYQSTCSVCKVLNTCVDGGFNEGFGSGFKMQKC